MQQKDVDNQDGQEMLVEITDDESSLSEVTGAGPITKEAVTHFGVLGAMAGGTVGGVYSGKIVDDKTHNSYAALGAGVGGGVGGASVGAALAAGATAGIQKLRK
jgi:hypothetical protein